MKTKILRLRRTIALYLLIKVIVEIKTNQGKHQIRLRRILVQIAISNKSNPPTPLPLAVTPLPSRKTRSMITRT